MRLSQLFTKTSFTFPKEEVSINARLLSKARFIDKLMAGVYIYLPLGFRVLKKIENIVRREMESLGAQEILMSVLQPKTLWDKTNRFDKLLDIFYLCKDKDKKVVVLGPTHEEIVTPLIKKFVQSYKDLPIAVFQIQTKFRKEPRAKSGLIRCREFLMKDLYSFHATKEDLERFYKKVIKSYLKIFKELELKVIITEASGGVFTKEYSHEFMVESKGGEDKVILCSKCGWAQNKEIAHLKASQKCPRCKGALIETKTIEVANTFKLGCKFSKDFGLFYKDAQGKNRLVEMGCYGLGVSRALASIVEVHSDREGIIWPKKVAPFQIHLINLDNSSSIKKRALEVYQKLSKSFEVLWDDRKLSPGIKLKDADLLGIPVRIIVSVKTGRLYEFKLRTSPKTYLLNFNSLIKKLKSFYK